MSTELRNYKRATERLRMTDQAFKDAERAYIDKLLSDQGLKMGDMIQNEDASIVIRIDEVVVSVEENRIFSVKGPVRKKDGSLSDKQVRNIVTEDGSLNAYVDD